VKEANPGVVLKHNQCQDITTFEPGTLNPEPYIILGNFRWKKN
jgi:hypothetical protein